MSMYLNYWVFFQIISLHSLIMLNFLMSSDEENDYEKKNRMQAGRVARFFLFKNRDKNYVKKSQLKVAIDKTNDEKNKETNMINLAKEYFNKALGLDIVSYTKPQKKVASDFFLVRTEEYPPDIPIPFSEDEKREYGLLAFTYFALSFNNNNPMSLENLSKVYQKFDMEDAFDDFGKIQGLLKKWTKEGYLSETKTGQDQKLEYGYGPRFELEVGKERLTQLMRDIIQKRTEFDD